MADHNASRAVARRNKVYLTRAEQHGFTPAETEAMLARVEELLQEPAKYPPGEYDRYGVIHFDLTLSALDEYEVWPARAIYGATFGPADPGPEEVVAPGELKEWTIGVEVLGWSFPGMPKWIDFPFDMIPPKADEELSYIIEANAARDAQSPTAE